MYSDAAGAYAATDFTSVAVGSAWASPEVAAKLGDYTQLGKRAHAASPGSRLVELPGVGHLPQVEAFDAYTRALSDFLR